MRIFAVLSLSLLLISAACATSTPATNGGGGVTEADGVDPNTEADKLENQAYDAIGDVRVYYYVKSMTIPSARDKDSFARQEEQKHILVNKGHSMYRDEKDYMLPDEEHILYNADMYDLLRIFKELGFFDTGHSINILGDDPIARADREPRTQRVIAVQQIKGGKVNTSYFARIEGEAYVDRDDDPTTWERSKSFNECQAVFMQAISGALPKGDAEYGTSNKTIKRR
ncbi:MAG: hypothetical protein K8I27_04065 [Planctomycetes bacterium]|nr:hypothetical protein [Planctomycetota bacterium]